MRREKIWTQLEEKLDEDEVKKDERERFFKVYTDEAELEKDIKKDYNLWATYPDDDPLQKPFALKRKAQRRYEIFCGGFIYYHDVEFKKYPTGTGFDGKQYPDKDFEHYIYFKWLPEGKGNKEKTKVEIYVTKTPEEYNSDPPKPPAPPPPES